MSPSTREQGLFIVLEGTDGSGKGTQFELLAEHLRKIGHDVATFDFPQYDQPSSYFVKRYLNGDYGTADEIGPYTASLFYALDRYEAAPAIREALEQGKVVLANRFTGSNMAHQGTKFAHAEERRGYFIWLDNLEFEMLKIPRPDVSFVLRVPAKTAQKLVDKKGARNYTDKKRDLHEADLTHMERAVTVYDDLCELFPKDFQRIDCVRGEKLLPVETVQDLLRKKLEPLLPPVTATKTKSAAANVAKSKAVAEAPSADSGGAAQLTGQHLVIENASQLLAQKMERSRLTIYLEQPNRYLHYDQKDANGNYKYYVPEYLPANLKTAFCAHLDEIFRLYSSMLKDLANYIKETATSPAEDDAARAQACDTLRSVLPVAAKSTVDVYTDGQILESLINHLLSDQLPEARQAGEDMLKDVMHTNPALLAHVGKPEQNGSYAAYRSNVNVSVKKLADDYLSDKHADGVEPVRLVAVWPRNEFDLVPDMMYEHSNLPLREIQDEVAGWPYEKRLGIFEAYIGERRTREHRPGRALEKAHYSWDLVCDFAVFRDLQRHRIVDGLEWQELTPRHGYDMPKLIEDAGLEEQFQQCFDISLKLHSLLQSSGYMLEAQYATLLGHKMRWKVTYNAREAFYLHELHAGPQTHPNTREFVKRIHEKLSETHPLLGESMRFVNQPDKSPSN